MSSINNVRHLGILNFSQKNKKSKMEKKMAGYGQLYILLVYLKVSLFRFC